MSRYIDADELRNEWLYGGENERIYDTNDVLNSIDDQPDADVVPLIHSRWKYDIDGIYECLNCYWKMSIPEIRNNPTYEYCPYCGAKMDEKEKE